MLEANIVDQHGLYPFNVAPDTNTLYSLDDFGYCFVVLHGSSKDLFLDDFCKNTSLTKDDFEIKYTYFATYILVTHKQHEFGEYIDEIVKNVTASSWNLNTTICCPI